MDMVMETLSEMEMEVARPEGPSAVERLEAAEALYRRNRAAGLAALNELFRSGTAPQPALHGRYPGRLVALDVTPGLTQFGEWLGRLWRPWKGKSFDRATGRGDNVFGRDSYLLAHLFWPLYRGYRADGPESYRAFACRTYVAAGKEDPDRPVLKIDYDLAENPAATIRRVLDELVEVDGGVYLGKAHAQWWWGAWQMVAYFVLADVAPRPQR